MTGKTIVILFPMAAARVSLHNYGKKVTIIHTLSVAPVAPVDTGEALK